MKYRTLFLLAVICLLFTGCFSKTTISHAPVPVSEERQIQPKTPENENQNVPVPYYNTYTISVDINPSLRTVSGVEKVRFKNTTEKSLTEIYMNVYLNAFGEKCDYTPYTPEDKEFIFPYGMDYSRFKINSLTINNETVSYSLNNTVLNLKLQKPLEIEEETEITIVFECYVPKISARFGANQNAMWGASLFPTISPYQNGDFIKSYYYPVGDTFQNTISNYDVTVTMPEDYTMASTGTVMQFEQNNRNVAVISAKMVRDFAFAISNQYKKKTIDTNDGIEISIYYAASDDKLVSDILSVAKNTIEFYSAYIGNYPYQTLSMVETSVYTGGGLEFPQIVFFDENVKKPENTIVTELAHQWFTWVIGIDSVNESWLSLGLSGFMQNYKTYGSKNIAQAMEKEYLSLEDFLQKENATLLLQPLGEFQSTESFYHIQYQRSVLMMYSLYETMGQKQFHELLRQYYAAYSFKTATANDFKILSEKIYGKNLDSFFKQWLHSDSLPELF